MKTSIVYEFQTSPTTECDCGSGPSEVRPTVMAVILFSLRSTTDDMCLLSFFLFFFFVCKNWGTVTKHLGKAGSESIDKRTAAVDVSAVPVEAALAAQSLMKDITGDGIKSKAWLHFIFMSG